MNAIRLICAVLLAFALAGCNTVHGLGQDIEKAGETIQKGAK